MNDQRYARYRYANLKLRDEAREQLRRERVERILSRLPMLKRGSEMNPRTFTAEAYRQATERAREAVSEEN